MKIEKQPALVVGVQAAFLRADGALFFGRELCGGSHLKARVWREDAMKTVGMRTL